jgi:hypothetical protein
MGGSGTRPNLAGKLQESQDCPVAFVLGMGWSDAGGVPEVATPLVRNGYYKYLPPLLK